MEYQMEKIIDSLEHSPGIKVGNAWTCMIDFYKPKNARKFRITDIWVSGGDLQDALILEVYVGGIIYAKEILYSSVFAHIGQRYFNPGFRNGEEIQYRMRRAAWVQSVSPVHVAIEIQVDAEPEA